MVAEWTGRSRPARTSSSLGAATARGAGAGASASASGSASTSGAEAELAMDTSAPPPFLNKTYDMVNDSSTDSVVSWGEKGNSFVVWNSTDFAEKLLPKHFKHSNFSSFVRQLNTYGFRKVDPDRWEFANEGFLKGKKHLLKNIHRRKPAPHPPAVQQQQPAAPQRPVEVGNYGIEGEIERLKRDKNVLMAELVRLRQQQQQTDRNVQMLMQRVHMTEQRQQQMVSFLAKAMQSPSFLSQLVQQNESKKRLATAARKKRRLPKDDEADSTPAEETSPTHSEGQIVKYQPNANDPVTMFLQLMNSPDFSSSPKIDMSNLEFSIRDLEHSLHRSRMVEDLPSTGIIKDLTDSFTAESPVEQQNQQTEHQMQLGSLIKLDSVQDMEQGEEDNRTDGESSTLPLDEGLSDLPDDEAFWKQMFDGTGDSEADFDDGGMDALNGMESLTLLQQ